MNPSYKCPNEFPLWRKAKSCFFCTENHLGTMKGSFGHYFGHYSGTIRALGDRAQMNPSYCPNEFPLWGKQNLAFLHGKSFGHYEGFIRALFRAHFGH